MIKHLGVDHIGIAVQDIQAATETFTKVLGLTDGGQHDLPERDLSVRFILPGDGTRIELLASAGPHSEVASFLEKRGSGVHHIALRVESIDEAIKQLEIYGFKPLASKHERGAHGGRVVFLHPKQTHGVLIELLESASPQGT